MERWHVGHVRKYSILLVSPDHVILGLGLVYGYSLVEGAWCSAVLGCRWGRVVPHDTGIVLPGVCITVTVWEFSVLGRGMCSTEWCSSSVHWWPTLQGGPAKVKPLTFLLVTFECIDKIQWFLAHVNYIQQVVWCKFYANFFILNT